LQKEEGRGKKEEGRGKKEEGRRKKEEGRKLMVLPLTTSTTVEVYVKREHLTFAKKCSGSVSLPRNLIGSETLPLPIYENEKRQRHKDTKEEAITLMVFAINNLNHCRGLCNRRSRFF
jgi:hypothetical protein